jgi:hypothetical protein
MISNHRIDPLLFLLFLFRCLAGFVYYTSAIWLFCRVVFTPHTAIADMKEMLLFLRSLDQDNCLKDDYGSKDTLWCSCCPYIAILDPFIRWLAITLYYRQIQKMDPIED